MEDEIAVLVPPLLEWLQCPHRPTAVIAYNETFALALYESARRNGLGIPDDLSVVAFDDIHAAAALPAMTVVSLELFGVGARALELCADMIDGKRSVPPDGRLVEHVRGRLAVRNSHGPAPK